MTSVELVMDETYEIQKNEQGGYKIVDKVTSTIKLEIPTDMKTIRMKLITGTGIVVPLTILDGTTVEGLQFEVTSDVITGVKTFLTYIKDNVTKIEITDTFGDIVTTADNVGTFEGYKKLITANFPQMTGSIGKRTFNGCESLKSVEFPLMDGSIEANAFEGCTSLKIASFPRISGTGTVADTAFEGVTLKLLDLSSYSNSLKLTATQLKNMALSYGGTQLDLNSVTEFNYIYAPKQNAPTGELSGNYLFIDKHSSNVWIPEPQYDQEDWFKFDNDTTVTTIKLNSDGTDIEMVTKSIEETVAKYLSTQPIGSDEYIELSSDYHLNWNNMKITLVKDVGEHTITDVENTMQLFYFNTDKATINVDGVSYEMSSNNVFTHIGAGEGRVLIVGQREENKKLVVFYLEKHSYMLSDRNLHEIKKLAEFQFMSSVVLGFLVLLTLLVCLYLLYRK